MTFYLLIFGGHFQPFWSYQPFLGQGQGVKLLGGFILIYLQLLFSRYCSILALSCSFEFVWWWLVWLWFPSEYLVPTQLQFWLFCCWDCGCYWAVTKMLFPFKIPILRELFRYPYYHIHQFWCILGSMITASFFWGGGYPPQQ